MCLEIIENWRSEKPAWESESECYIVVFLGATRLGGHWGGAQLSEFWIFPGSEEYLVSTWSRDLWSFGLAWSCVHSFLVDKKINHKLRGMLVYFRCSLPKDLNRSSLSTYSTVPVCLLGPRRDQDTIVTLTHPAPVNLSVKHWSLWL